MKHFQEILITLGASNVSLIKEAECWDLWRAEYRTPISTVVGYYLYLKNKCPLKEATAANIQYWQSTSGSSEGYEIIVTPQSDLTNDLQKAKKTFRGKNIRTSKQLLLDNFLKDFSQKPFVEEAEYFIDPSLQLENGRTVQEATKFLIQWFGDKVQTTKHAPPVDSKINNPSWLAILTANGGVGKTTLSRILCTKIRAYDPSAIPILVESEQWRHLLQSTITLDALWDLALSRRFEQAGRLLANKTALRVLIREGLFVIVFDGFDELCLSPSAVLKPQDVIGELIQLLTPEDEVGHAKILLTARETYWETIKDEAGIDKVDKVEVFKLKGFDNDQKKRYFENRLSDPTERDLALRISKAISGGIYSELNSEGNNEDKFSGVPFILDLIARYVCENDQKTINPYQTDPLLNFLEDVCRRENRRQSLDLNPFQQFMVFEELFRQFQDGFTLEDLKLCLDVICNVTDLGVISRFTNHVFLTKLGVDRYESRYGVLSTYFVARFLANGLVEMGKKTPRTEIARILAGNFTGKTQLIDWLVQQLRRLDKSVSIQAIRHAFEIVKDKENIEVRKASSMALFHLINDLIESQDKLERTQQLAEFYNATKISAAWKFEDITLTDTVRAFDFRGCEFIRCRLVGAEFKNCVFDKQTIFKNTYFEDTVIFKGCRDANQIQLMDCTYSKEAECALNQVRNLSTRVELKRAFAEDALIRALKRFRGDYGFSHIQYRHRRSGFKPGNPYNDQIWDMLLRKEIIAEHRISNVDEGGLNVVEDKELRKEISSLLDNGILGLKLREVIAGLIE